MSEVKDTCSSPEVDSSPSEDIGEDIRTVISPETFVEWQLHDAWLSIGQSLAVLSSGEARPRLTFSQDITSLYAVTQEALGKALDRLGEHDGVATFLASDDLDAAKLGHLLDMHNRLFDFIKEDNFMDCPPTGSEDPRARRFVFAVMFYVDLFDDAADALLLTQASKAAVFANHLTTLAQTYLVESAKEAS